MSPQLLWYSCPAPWRVCEPANPFSLAHQVNGVSSISSKQGAVTRITQSAASSGGTPA